MFRIIYSLLMMIVCTTTGCITDDEPKGPSLSVGDPLPQFSVTMNTGEEISTQSLKGKVAVIVFFNTGCSDCRQELPVIQKLWEEYEQNLTVKIVAIAREENEAEIKQYWNENNFTLPFSPQDTKEVYSLFAPSVIPRIYITNPEGIITFTFDDSHLPSLSSLQEAITQSIQDPD